MSGEVLGERGIIKRVTSTYDNSPKGWRILTGISASGNPELLIIGKENWMIRRDRYAPDRPGIGISMENTVVGGTSGAYYGLRPIADDYMDEFMSMISRGVDPTAVMNYLDSVAARVLRKQNPISVTELAEIKARGALQGPVVSSYRPLHSIIRGQRELDEKLDRELSEMKRKYASSYIG